MPSNMASQQFPMPSSQGKLETRSENFDASREIGSLELVTNGPSVQRMSISNMQTGSIASGICSPTSQQTHTSNMQTVLSDDMSTNLDSPLMSNQQSSHIDLLAFKPQWQPLIGPQYSAGGNGVVSKNLVSQQLSGKRKSPPAPDGSAAQKLSVPNKRMVPQMENRPWLQNISSPNSSSAPIQSTSVSPRTQPSKKTMQVESVSGKSGKQTTGRKQYVQAQPSPKPQNVSDESVRSKMRESLAAALALVQQRNKGEKNFLTEAASSSGKTEGNYEATESTSAASGSHDSVAEGTTPTLTTSGEVSIEKDGDGQIAFQETSANSNQSDGQNFHFKDAFPQVDFPFSESIFANDELLLGNGLLWVLDPVTDYGEKEDNEVAETPKLDDEEVGRAEAENSVQDPELLAFKIEMELFKLFGGVNKKYKEKGRSLLFNLKDKNNPELREKVMSGEILPERLCSMTAEELASKELSEWRQAKEKEQARMVVLPDTEVDIRRLVKKTHKGEFQVEVEPMDEGIIEVSVGVSSFSQPGDKVKEKESSLPAKTTGKEEETNAKATEKDHGTSCAMAVPSNEGSDLIQGLSVDDEMKDTEFLPPIVSLDEFRESLNKNPPFEKLPEDAGKKTPVPENSDSEIGSEFLKSSEQTPKKPVDSPEAKQEKTVVSSPKPDIDVKLTVQSEKTPAAAFKGERVWEGLLQFSISSVTSVIGIFKSGERTPASEWPALLDVKGRVRLDAFGKFLQELPKSRSRAVMVMYLVCKEGVSKSLSEVVESYVADGRVGYAEPAAGVELYLCPSYGKTLDMISKIVPKDQLDDSKFLDNGLIGVVVWRRVSTSPSTPSGRKSGYKRQRSGTRRTPSPPDDKNENPNVNFFAPAKQNDVPNNEMAHVMNDDRGNDDDDDDDDPPPGFGPGAARDDDDLPEFNFSSSGGSSFPSQVPPQTHSVDQVRALIHKYGKSAGGISTGVRSWNKDDDEDDIPEWQPQAPMVNPEQSQLARNYQTQLVNRQVKTGITVRPGIRPNVLQQPEGWWPDQNTSELYNGKQRAGAQPRSRGF